MTDLFESKDVAPMLIAENKPPFNSPDYIYELKFDGIRCIAYLDKEKTILRNKRNKDVTAIYPELSQMHRQLKRQKQKCVLDGEIFVFYSNRTDFFETQRRSLMTNPFRIELASKKMPVSFTAFDILYLNGSLLTGKPLIERKDKLEKAISESSRLSVSRYFEGNGIDLYAAAEKQGLEGIVAKKKRGFYYPGKRTKEWVKCKVLMDEDFVVCGYYHKDAYASIILGMYDGDRLAYRSHVVMGVSKHDFKTITSQREVSKEREYPDFPDFDKARWIAPVLVCSVKYMERTPGGGLRQPVFKGLRDDKIPQECVDTGQ